MKLHTRYLLDDPEAVDEFDLEQEEYSRELRKFRLDEGARRSKKGHRKRHNRDRTEQPLVGD